MTAMQQHRPSPDFFEHPSCHRIDRRPMRFERSQQIPLEQRRRAEMIFQRFGRDRALHTATIDQRRKCDDQIASAIFGRFRWKGNLHLSACHRRDDPMT
ncbi:hypothetical protein ABIC50_004989 [Burkholderia sp. 567]